jgi:hypothetical protein
MRAIGKGADHQRNATAGAIFGGVEAFGAQGMSHQPLPLAVPTTTIWSLSQCVDDQIHVIFSPSSWCIAARVRA